MTALDDERLHAAAQARLWNDAVPIGAPVLVAEGEPCSVEPCYRSTRTRTEAWAIWEGNGQATAVVRVEGRAAAVELARVVVDVRRIAAVPHQLSLLQSGK